MDKITIIRLIIIWYVLKLTFVGERPSDAAEIWWRREAASWGRGGGRLACCVFNICNFWICLETQTEKYKYKSIEINNQLRRKVIEKHIKISLGLFLGHKRYAPHKETRLCPFYSRLLLWMSFCSVCFMMMLLNESSLLSHYCVLQFTFAQTRT